MFAKDSVLDLASLVKNSSSTISEPQEEGESSQVKVITSGDSDQDLTSLGRQESDDTPTTTSETDIEGLPRLETEDSTIPRHPPTSASSSNDPYAGFRPDAYSGYNNEEITYDHDPYAPTVFGGPGARDGGSIWCCLLAPWLVAKHSAVDDDGQVSVGSLKRSLSGDEDERSTGSEVYGEKLTDKDRMAIMARLRLPQTDPQLSSGSTPAPSKKGLLEEIPSYDDTTSTPDPREQVGANKIESHDKPSPVRPKGILKRRGSSFQKVPSKQGRSPSKATSGHTTPRRSLFPTVGDPTLPVAVKHVKFSPMARVVAIKSRRDMTFLEKSWIWWQKSDYDSFKKAGRIIGKAILEGGSEVWLTSSTSFGASPARPAARTRSFHLSDRDPDLRSHETGTQLSPDDYGDKWWCRFGHSRRGLEHISSMEEGRQRQMNVRASIRATLDEQRKQRAQGCEDNNKLRSVSLRHTTWARDLSLAAGSADAEAVKSEFSSDSKSREYYLLKQAKTNAGTGREVPSFMMPSGSTVLSLDANTSTQIRMRRKQVVPQPISRSDKKQAVKSETLEAIHDRAENGDILSKKAAGFGTEATDMAAVLSGMGALSKDREISAAPAQARVGAH